MDVTLTASNTSRFVAIGFPEESVGMVGAQTSICIPQYNMIIKYDIKGYADQSELLEKKQTLIYASVEAVDGEIFLKLKNFLLDEGGNDIIVDGT